MKTSYDFWTEKWGEEPQSDSDKLAVAMMQEYAEYYHKYLVSKE